MAQEAPLTVDTGSNEPALPPVAALFEVKFDHRKGYIVAWQKSIEAVDIEGAVEFKSLPSGLHNVEEDLVYFVFDQYAGISAYINSPGDPSARNANMLAVGALVPLDHGKTGKSWLHAEGLKDLARKQVGKTPDTTALDEYWDRNKLEDDHPFSPRDDSHSDVDASHSNGQLNGYQRSRAMSASTLFTPGSARTLTPHHPAATLLEFLHVFGPLMFPLYRAALLRRRILIVTEAPVELACNIVYNLSILSTLPLSLTGSVPCANKGNLRIQALFNVGIQDIPLLSQPSSSGWVACTTDDVLATKPECFDVIVFLPSADSKLAQEQVYPRIVMSSPELTQRFPKNTIRSTQRDAQRYDVLRAGLAQYHKSQTSATPVAVEEPAPSSETEPDDDAISITSTTSTIRSRKDLVESASWSQVAYSSLVWWASSGDRRIGLTEEEEQQREQDLALLGSGDDDGDNTKEVVMIQFFRRLTAVMFQAVQNVVRAEEGRYRDEAPEEQDRTGGQEQDGEEDEQRLLQSQKTDQQRELNVDSEDVLAMSLDIWSSSDRDFVRDFVQVWWGRKASVKGRSIECCGIRLL